MRINWIKIYIVIYFYKCTFCGANNWVRTELGSQEPGFFKHWKELGIKDWIFQHSQRKMSREESMQTDWRSAEWLVGSIEVQLYLPSNIFGWTNSSCLMVIYTVLLLLIISLNFIHNLIRWSQCTVGSIWTSVCYCSLKNLSLTLDVQC